jgi:hypothetical protein
VAFLSHVFEKNKSTTVDLSKNYLRGDFTSGFALLFAVVRLMRGLLRVGTNSPSA